METLKKAENATVGTTKALIFDGLKSAARNFSGFPYGAQGGNGASAFTGFYAGGKGAEIGADFSLTAGEKLNIIVGGAGGTGFSESSCGGGGAAAL